MILMYENEGRVICETHVEIDHASRVDIGDKFKYVIEKSEENSFLNRVIGICVAMQKEMPKWKN